MDNVLRFYLLATTLKDKIRQGSNYWNVESKRRESIAEHIYGTCILAIAMDSEYNLGINLERVLKMLVIHELEEVFIGDITPFDGYSEEELLDMGRQAVISVLGDLTKKDEYIKITNEFNKRDTKDAKFAHLIDKLEFVLYMMKLCDQGKIHLGKKTSKKILESEKVQVMLGNGATEAKDIFFLYDRNKFANSEEFSEILSYAYKNDMKQMLDKFLN